MSAPQWPWKLCWICDDACATLTTHVSCLLGERSLVVNRVFPSRYIAFLHLICLYLSVVSRLSMPQLHPRAAAAQPSPSKRSGAKATPHLLQPPEAARSLIMH